MKIYIYIYIHITYSYTYVDQKKFKSSINLKMIS